MGTSSCSSSHHHQPSSKMLPPAHQQPLPGGLPPIFLFSSNILLSPAAQEPRSNSNNIREPTIESTSSQESKPTAIAVVAKKMENGKEKNDNDCPGQSIIPWVSSADKITLFDIAKEQVDVISEKMYCLPVESLEELKNELQVILEGRGDPEHNLDFSLLQRHVDARSDLTAETLIKAHRVQLEILVAINTGIQAFLNTNVGNLSQTSLVDVFILKRCKNIECQSQLPANGCTCDICTNRKGFCKCTCMNCNKFDNEVETLHWIGCDSCHHWSHTDCAIRDGQICMGPSVNNGAGLTDLFFRCQACNHKSELFGWVKDVFEHFAPGWNREALMRELDFVSRIFRGSEDPRGNKLFWKCEDLLEKMRGGLAESTACEEISKFFKAEDEGQNQKGKAKVTAEEPQHSLSPIQKRTHLEVQEQSSPKRIKSKIISPGSKIHKNANGINNSDQPFSFSSNHKEVNYLSTRDKSPVNWNEVFPEIPEPKDMPSLDNSKSISIPSLNNSNSISIPSWDDSRPISVPDGGIPSNIGGGILSFNSVDPKESDDGEVNSILPAEGKTSGLRVTSSRPMDPLVSKDFARSCLLGALSQYLEKEFDYALKNGLSSLRTWWNSKSADITKCLRTVFHVDAASLLVKMETYLREVDCCLSKCQELDQGLSIKERKENLASCKNKISICQSKRGGLQQRIDEVAKELESVDHEIELLQQKKECIDFQD